jgi:NADPH:quinone reductase-like Zn-dependent oxidoreductase
VLGGARLTKVALVVDTNSRERMDRALAILRPALGTLVGAGFTSHEDVVHDMRQQPSRRASRRTRDSAPSPDMDPAALAEAFNRIKEAHYRRTLDEPVPMLGNRTPRECARTKPGRKKLASWIKEIENGELRQAVGTGVPPYDVSWMWRELGVDEER